MSIFTVLSMINNTTRTCTCPGNTITYTCTTVGGVATLWSGSAFPSDCDITLNHSRFSDIGGTQGLCRSNRGFTGRSVEKTNNCYTSQLTVPVNSDSINKTIQCAVVHNSTSTSLIGTEVISTTGEHRPQVHADVQPM